MKVKPYRWWHGVAFYAGVRLCSWGLRALAGAAVKRQSSKEGDRELYHAEKLPVFAPPAPAFPIAWTINNVSSIAGGLHVLNLPEGTKGRQEFLQLQAVAWAIYTLFEAGYFGLRSPVNAAAITLLYGAATAASLTVALRQLQDREAALSLASTVAWLALATPLGLAQAAWNHDPFWNVGPFAEPQQRWLKSAA